MRRRGLQRRRDVLNELRKRSNEMIMERKHNADSTLEP